MVEGEAFEVCGGGKGGGDAVGAGDLNGGVGATAEKGAELRAGGVALFVQHDVVLIEAGEGHLGAQDIGLRGFAGGVFGEGGGEGLVEDGGLLVVEAHLVCVAEEGGCGLADGGGDLMAESFEVVGGGLGVVFGEFVGEIELLLAGEGLLQGDHDLGLVEVPGLAQGRLPVADHEHWVVEAARSGGLHLRETEAADGGADLRVGMEGLVDGVVDGEYGSRRGLLSPRQVGQWEQKQ